MTIFSLIIMFRRFAFFSIWCGLISLGLSLETIASAQDTPGSAATNGNPDSTLPNPSNPQVAPVAPAPAPAPAPIPETSTASPATTPSGDSIWTNPPKVIDPSTRDAGLEALPAAPTGDSVIQAPATDMDQNAHTVLCTSTETQKVTVVGNNFRMRCTELTVYFNKSNKIDHMIANGSVVIEQPDRLTLAGNAAFTQSDNKIVLTEQPEIYDDKRHIKGDVITIFRGKNTMNVTNSTMIIPGDSAKASTTPTPTP